MKKRSFRSTFVSVILVITVAISIVNLAVYGINIKKLDKLHTYGNTPIALLAVDINYKTFQSILENAFYEDSGECFILTGEQELFHIGEDLYQKEEKGYIFDKSQKMMKENLIVDTFQSKGKNFYISSRQNMLSGWKIIQVIPEERLFEEVDQKIKWNSIFLLGALILVVSFSIYYTKKLLNH